jgi:Glu-tRNA(Gln) amidotransferase subunit E-like FAD-binding protein
MKQLHKRFDNKQVKEMFKKYEQGKLKREALEEVLTIKSAIS